MNGDVLLERYITDSTNHSWCSSAYFNLAVKKAQIMESLTISSCYQLGHHLYSRYVFQADQQAALRICCPRAGPATWLSGPGAISLPHSTAVPTVTYASGSSLVPLSCTSCRACTNGPIRGVHDTGDRGWSRCRRFARRCGVVAARSRSTTARR